jgi:hypothetical protein
VDRGQEKDVRADSLRALLAHAIDYAGLFPPASLALEPALQNYAEYIRTPDAWMLGAFILPVTEFAAAARGLPQFDSDHPLRISALGPKTDSAEAFQISLAAAMDSIASFRSMSGGTALIEQFEMPLPANISAETIKMIRDRVVSGLRTFWEAPADAAERAIKLIADNNRSHPAGNLGFKLRTGGVTANAFPSSSAIAAALMAAGTHQVPIKFTAGLHHPVRIFHESVQTKMHGFLNVLGAGVLALEHDWTEKQLAEMLEDEDATSFSFTEGSFAWREWRVATERVATHRELVTSLGSCSFDEPREDLRALNLL